jgi:hypothetical protein
MLSYVILIYAFCDAILDQDIVRKKLKTIILLSAIAYIVIVLQLLRGDRESIPFVFGLVLIYYFWATPFTLRRKLPKLKIMVGTFVVIVASVIIGAARSGLTDVQNIGQLFDFLGRLYESDSIGASKLFHGTWSAVFLTPLSVAGDHIHGLLDLKWGQTYLDLLLSVPPGFLADAVGYMRPIDGNAGPAWEMRYGIGGTHGSVVPFMNFRMAGVLIVTAFWAFIFSGYERKAMKVIRVRSLALLCTIAMVAPHWLWYGEKYVINALIIWLLLGFCYKVSLSLGHVFRLIAPTASHTSFQFNGRVN